jgi:DNA modification methylase
VSIPFNVTSPPYWGLRSYLADDDPSKALEMGAEPTLAEYVERLVVLFRELRRALKDGGTCWLNLGDSYSGGGMSNPSATSTLGGGKDRGAAGYSLSRLPPQSGLKPKDLCLVPYRVALALQADGWWLRDNIVWHKPNPMPASVTDRCTSAHEAVFLLTKSARYWFDAEAVKEPAEVRAGREHVRVRNVGGRTDGLTTGAGGAGFAAGSATRNLRNVWTIATSPYSGSHYAVMPPALVEPCVKAGCPAGGLVLDPFGGSGTVGQVAESLGRKWLLFDLDARNEALMAQRTAQRSLLGMIR